jgi:group I intron endonuclease
MIIYKATNTINNRCYIGQTINSLQWSINKHKVTSKKSKLYFHNAIRKYGIECFVWEVLCECESREELNEMEFHYIKQYQSHYREFGYNIDMGGSAGNCLEGECNGMFGISHTDESKELMSQKNKGNIPWNKGIPRSQEVKDTISQKNKGNKSWCKGLTLDDDRVRCLIDKRNKTMKENDLYKKARDHPNFRHLDEDLIIKLMGDGISSAEIGRMLNINRSLLSRRIKLLKSEGKYENNKQIPADRTKRDLCPLS